METDDLVRQALHRAAAGIDTDTTQNLAAVRRKAGRKVVRRRFTVAVAAAVTVVGVVLAALWLGDLTGGQRGIGPANDRKPTPGRTDQSLGVANPFTITRTFTPGALGLQHPLRVAVAPSGDLYVTDKSQTVTELSPDGKVLRQWGRPGSGPGEFRLFPGGLAVGNDGKVYVADTGNFRIQVFSPTGRFIEQFGAFGTGFGRFLWPSDVAVDDHGDVYVSDDRGAKLTKLSPSGRPLWRLGGHGTSDPDLVGHEHLAGVDARGRLLMANDDKGRVVTLDPAGRKVDAFGSGSALGAPRGTFPHGACDATTDAAGFVYVNSCEESGVSHHNTEMFDADHRLVGAWRDGPFSSSPRFGPGGVGYVVAYDGSILELHVSRP